MALDATAFRAAMGALASGVTVVTARRPDGVALGMTATSVTSLSLAPPLILVCVDHDADLHPTIVQADRFGVLVLSADQQDVAARFATRGQHAFGGGEPTTPGGLPTLPGVLAVLECRRDAVLPGGDHSIITGVLEWADRQPGIPLLHFAGRYGQLHG